MQTQPQSPPFPQSCRHTGPLKPTDSRDHSMRAMLITRGPRQEDHSTWIHVATTASVSIAASSSSDMPAVGCSTVSSVLSFPCPATGNGTSRVSSNTTGIAFSFAAMSISGGTAAETTVTPVGSLVGHCRLMLSTQPPCLGVGTLDLLSGSTEEMTPESAPKSWYRLVDAVSGSVSTPLAEPSGLLPIKPGLKLTDLPISNNRRTGTPSSVSKSL